MKTATITWITYNNYGTELQAFALQRYILSQGIDNTIISDEMILKGEQITPSLTNNCDNISGINVQRIKALTKKYLPDPKKFFTTCLAVFNDRIQQAKTYKKQKSYYQSQELFESFKHSQLKILYGKARNDMPTLNDDFDAFVCGSDQIWSTFDCNFDGYYFLDFAKKKKFSYATSLGTTIIDKKKMCTIKEWTNDFYKISVREKESSEQLASSLDRTVEWVLDPTLLHDKNFWISHSKRYPIRHKYLVCYFLENKSWYLEYAKELCKHLKLKLVIIPSSKFYSECKFSLKRGVGPQEFLDIISNAHFVLTDSYHASIFSLIFEKNFLCFKRFKDDDANCQNVRIYSLFNLLDINNIVEEKMFSPEDIVSLEYTEINKILDEQRNISKNYLKGCLL